MTGPRYIANTSDPRPKAKARKKEEQHTKANGAVTNRERAVDPSPSVIAAGDLDDAGDAELSARIMEELEKNQRFTTGTDDRLPRSGPELENSHRYSLRVAP